MHVYYSNTLIHLSHFLTFSNTLHQSIQLTQYFLFNISPGSGWLSPFKFYLFYKWKHPLGYIVFAWCFLETNPHLSKILAAASLRWISVISLWEGGVISVPFFHHLLPAPITANLEASLPIYPSQFNLFFLVQGEGSCTPVLTPNYQLAIKEAHLQTDVIIKLCESQKNGLFAWCWHPKPHQRGCYLFQIIIPWWLINLTIFLFWETNKRNLCLHFMAIYHSFGFQIASLRSKERGGMVFCCLMLRAKLDDTSVFSNC